MSAEHAIPIAASAAPASKAGATRRGRPRIFAILALLAVAAGGGYYWYRSAHGVVADKPLVATVSYGNVENSVASAGNLQPSNTLPVGAQVSGQLQKLHVKVGDQVEAGQMLGEIDARVQRNKVDSSRANIASAEAQIEARRSALELAEANAKRQQRLSTERATSQLEFDTAMNNLRSAQAGLIQQEQSILQSRSTLATDETLLEYTQLFAPISGTVVSIAMKEGTTLNATQQSPIVMQIANLSTMTVETQVSEADVGKLHIGMEVYFTTLGGGNRRWYSTLRQILPTPVATNNVVTYTGLFDIDNSDGALLSGMTTQVYFVTSAARNVLTVPVGALAFVETPRGGEGLAARAGAGGRSGAIPNGDAAPGSDAPLGVGAVAVRPAVAVESPGAVGGAARAAEGKPRGGGFAGGGSAGGGFPGGASRADARPRQAKVRVVNADGSITEREVTVGVMSRVAAEVITGLTEGEQVVAGIVQAAAPGTVDPNANRNNGFPGNFGGGGFPGGGFPGGGFPGGNPGGGRP